MQLKISIDDQNAKAPTYATSGAGAFDFYSPVDIGPIAPGASFFADLGLRVEVPEGYTLLMFSRSGHGFKNGVRLSNCVGVIDSDYRGKVALKLHNDSSTEFFAPAGSRVVQGMLVATPKVEIVEVKELTETQRMEGGFGSTGQ